MIRVDVILDTAGILKSCAVVGHASAGPRNEDIVCAAVSVLSRTALRTLSKTEGVTVRGNAPARGELFMEIEYAAVCRDQVAGITNFLLEGLLSISEEFSEHCCVRIQRERR
ncbi:ribosomal-processing cysteine protease Prp [Gracilinema caldarium]|uniref:ribosomal-processing cysteine protease Prp n=1 Tax=Gracilinema caldarium TaxID=215591 RepID=UPI0026E9B4AD|nr:ribosomal-processing cysteine protease Prp [Gracilinema caldarium]